ncbi:MAG: RNB domain-containing ribonuclease [Gemmatimonadota bacterium]|nr:RNB domain-containing ribonuclease [Gemmatimonadota bacterium]
MKTNEIVVFRHRGNIQIGRFDQANGKKIRIVTGRNRVFEIPANRVVFETRIDIGNNMTLEAFRKESQETAESLDLRDVWELMKEEAEEYSFKDIAEVYWPDPVSAVQYVSTLLYLEQDCPYFDLQESDYKPLTDELVEAHFLRIERNLAVKVEEAAFFEWFTGSDRQIPEDFTNRQRHALSRIQQYAMEGDEYEQSSQAKALLQEIKPQVTGDLQRYAFQMMVRKGIWDEDEHLDLIRYNVPVDFEDDVLKDACQVQMDESDREDLTGLEVFSIDDAATQDIDDAISVEPTENGYRIGVHITDVSIIIPRNSRLDRAARERTTSLYLPDRHIPMLPPEISNGQCSLLQGSRRCAVSYLFDFDQEFGLTDNTIVPSVIINKSKLSYDDVNVILDSEDHNLSETMQILNLAADTLYAQRMDMGAVELERVELSIRVDQEKNISLTTRTGYSAADHIVSELMILTNAMTARYFKDHQIPAIYRTQAEADFSGLDEVDNATVRRYMMIRKIRPMELNLDPKPHAMLGTDVYCQATSPIRRYSDLAMQRQLTSCIRGNRPGYNRDDLTDEISLIERNRSLNAIWSRREWYWFAKYMEQNPDLALKAVVLEVRDRDILVELKDFGSRLTMKQSDQVNVGDELYVRVTHADAWDGLLRLSQVAAPEAAAM